MSNPLWKSIRRLLVFIAIVFLWPMNTTYAAPELKVSVQAGLDQKSKEGKGAPIIFTIENNGTAFTGDLVVDTASGQSSGIGQSVPITIGEGEKQTITMYVDSINDPMNYGSPIKKNIFFYKNGWRSGEEIKHSGTQLVSSSSFPQDSLFIAGLADNIDRLSSLKDINLKDRQGTQLLNLTKQDRTLLPSEKKGWDAVDIIAVDGFPIADLSQKQQEAMLAWVESGGTLLISGSPNISAEAGIFADMLPLEITGNQELSPTLFNDKFKSPIPGFSAKLNKDAVVLSQKEDTILAASQLVGSGMILQTSFPMGSEAFRSSIGTKPYWTELLNKRAQLLNYRAMQPYYNSPTDDLTWAVGEANELFPSFKVSTPLLFGIIIVYIVLIIPLLYLLLKKRDKREHAWWIIPVTAIVVSFAIFAYGGKDRLSHAQLQHSAVYLLGPDKKLSGYYTEALLTDKSGDFTFAIQHPSTVAVNSSASSIFGSTTPPHHRAVLEKGAAEELLSFRNLGFWNVASVYGKTESNAIGSFETDLTLANNRLTGSVTNKFPFKVNDVTILSGSKKIELGSILAGETLNVQEEVKATILGARSASQSGYLNPAASSQEDLMKMRKEGLLEFSAAHLNDSSKPILSATTETQIMELSLNDRKAKNSPLSLLLQPIDIESKLTGSVKADGDLMEMEIRSSSGYPADLLDEGSKEYIFSEKEYTQTWKLPKDFTDTVKVWTALQLFGADYNRYEVHLLNVKSGGYELLEDKANPTIEPAADYVSKDGEVKLKLNFSDAQMGEPVHPPEIRLTGEVAK